MSTGKENEGTKVSSLVGLGTRLLIQQVDEALRDLPETLGIRARAEAIKILTDPGSTVVQLYSICEILFGATFENLVDRSAIQNERERLLRLARLVRLSSQSSNTLSAELRLELRSFAIDLMRIPVSGTTDESAAGPLTLQDERHLIGAECCGVRDVEPIDLYCHKGEIVALVGANGTGKSSLLNLLAARPTVARAKRVTKRAKTFTIEFVPAQVDKPKRNVLNSLLATTALVQPRFHNIVDVRRTVSQFLDRMGLDIKSADVNWTELSQGHAKRFALARAILAAPDLLLVDEPMANLDAHAEAKGRETLIRCAHHGVAVVITAQRYDTVAGWSNIHLLRRNDVSNTSSDTRWECEVAGADSGALVQAVIAISRDKQLYFRYDAAQAVLYFEELDERDPGPPNPEQTLLSGLSALESRLDNVSTDVDVYGYRLIINAPNKLHSDRVFQMVADTGLRMFSIVRKGRR